MTISVIIPVYNVKPYLERCVKSVQSQTYKDFEIILVDDGSSDGSSELCDELTTHYPNITVIHQHNQGISGARNTGIHQARGQYIVFLDADDAWLLQDGLERLVQQADETHADLVVFKGVHIWNNTHYAYTSDYDIARIAKLPDSSTIFEHLVNTQQFSMSACFIMVSKQILTDNDIYFPIGFISEDVYWSLHLWQHVKKVTILNMNFYGYYHREASVSTTPSIRVYESYDKIFNYWKKQCDENCQNASAIRSYLADMWINRGYGYFRLKAEDKPGAVRILESHTDILEFGISAKTKRARMMVKLFGVKTTAVLLGWYWRARNLITT